MAEWALPSPVLGLAQVPFRHFPWPPGPSACSPHLQCPRSFLGQINEALCLCPLNPPQPCPTGSVFISKHAAVSRWLLSKDGLFPSGALPCGSEEGGTDELGYFVRGNESSCLRSTNRAPSGWLSTARVSQAGAHPAWFHCVLILWSGKALLRNEHLKERA